jgi:hypothetical protein
MNDQQKAELKKLFNAAPSLGGVSSQLSNPDLLRWMAMLPNIDNNDIWDCWEEWQDEEE